MENKGRQSGVDELPCCEEEVERNTGAPGEDESKPSQGFSDVDRLPQSGSSKRELTP